VNGVMVGIYHELKSRRHMKLSDYQAQVLLAVLKDSLTVNIVGVFSYPYQQRLDMFNLIMNQQSMELQELGRENSDNEI